MTNKKYGKKRFRAPLIASMDRVRIKWNDCKVTKRTTFTLKINEH